MIIDSRNETWKSFIGDVLAAITTRVFRWTGAETFEIPLYSELYTNNNVESLTTDEIREKGAIPVLFTLTPRNDREKDSDRIQRKLTSFTPAIFALGKEMKVPVVDLNDISATKLEKFSKWKVDYHFYLDKIHTSAYGARLNAESAVPVPHI